MSGAWVDTLPHPLLIPQGDRGSSPLARAGITVSFTYQLQSTLSEKIPSPYVYLLTAWAHTCHNTPDFSTSVFRR